MNKNTLKFIYHFIIVISASIGISNVLNATISFEWTHYVYIFLLSFSLIYSAIQLNKTMD